MNQNAYKTTMIRCLALGCLFCGWSIFLCSPSAQQDRRTPVVEAVEKVLPAVVNISTSKEVTVRRRSSANNLFRSPFDDFFSPAFPDLFRTRPETYKLTGLGSGVIVEGGYVITNNHVITYDLGTGGQVLGADEIFVNLYANKKQYEATVVGLDPRADVAILELKGDLPGQFLPWGRSGDLMIGETVIGAGSALGQPFTVTKGIISALDRKIEVQKGIWLHNLIQTDADINQGNSGGPLVNINGEFIGLNTAILSPSGGSVGIGFAIPVSRVRKIYDYWIKDVLSLEDRMGIEIQEMDPFLMEHYYKKYFPNLKEENLTGIVVVEVSPGGLCEGKLERADILVEVDDKPIETINHLRLRLEEHSGDLLALGIIREGNKKTITVPIPHRKVERMGWLGMELQEIDNPYRHWFGINDDFKGLIVHRIQPDGPAGKAGIRRGDVILAINQAETSKLSAVEEIKEKAASNKPVSIIITRKEAGKWKTGTLQIRPAKYF